MRIDVSRKEPLFWATKMLKNIAYRLLMLLNICKNRTFMLEVITSTPPRTWKNFHFILYLLMQWIPGNGLGFGGRGKWVLSMLTYIGLTRTFTALYVELSLERRRRALQLVYVLFSCGLMSVVLHGIKICLFRFLGRQMHLLFEVPFTFTTTLQLVVELPIGLGLGCVSGYGCGFGCGPGCSCRPRCETSAVEFVRNYTIRPYFLVCYFLLLFIISMVRC